jgi:DNA polymerase-1
MNIEAPLYLIHTSNPYDGSYEFYCRSEDEGAIRKLTVSELTQADQSIVLFNIHPFLNICRHQSSPPPECIINVDDVLRLISQRSRDQSGERFWSALRMGRRFFPEPKLWKGFLNLFTLEKAPASGDEKSQLIKLGMAMLMSLWQDVLRKLESEGELERFIQIELPIQSIFARREYLGIPINQVELLKEIEKCNNEKYSAFLRIASATGVNPVGYNLSDYWKLIANFHNWESLERVETHLEERLEFRERTSDLVKDVLTYHSCIKTHNVFRNILSNDGRIYPHFDCCGTVTSRILLSQPPIQQLKRKYRGFISAEHHNQLVYLDYAQFEPGILASLSQDHQLIDAYHEVDLYTELAERSLGDATQRELAKKIFLAYCYGMSFESLNTLLATDNHTAADEVTLIQRFFEAYPGLEIYRQESIEKLRSTGIVFSMLGNGRKRTSYQNLTNKEVRWALNQRVQGTASLILKQAILNIAEAYSPTNILIPMHDAVLLQYNEMVEPNFINECLVLMTNAFQKWCPQMSPKIKILNFSDI